MAEKSQNIQDVFLNTLRKKKIPVTVLPARTPEVITGPGVPLLALPPLPNCR